MTINSNLPEKLVGHTFPPLEQTGPDSINAQSKAPQTLTAEEPFAGQQETPVEGTSFFPESSPGKPPPHP